MNFFMQRQKQTNWCWAAVASSVSRYYSQSGRWTQCRIANAELGQTNCCTDGGSTACNVPWFLDRALTRTRNLKSMTGVVARTDVAAEVSGRRPFCARIGWSGGGGHFVAITGMAGTTMTVDDPWYGRSYYEFSTFTTAYQGTGAWTHSYYTKKSA